MGLKRFLKQLFCHHFYKQLETEYLRAERHSEVGLNNVTYYTTYEYYAITSQCIKCDKERINESRVMAI